MKLVFIALAMINIMWFHFRVQRNQDAWNTLAKPPLRARTSAVMSLCAWTAVITLGRFMAYDWYECGKPIPQLVNVLQECAASEHGAVDKVALNSSLEASQ